MLKKQKKIFLLLLVLSLLMGFSCTLKVGEGEFPEITLLDVINSSTYSLGGTVTGQTGQNLVLANGSNQVTINPPDTTFTFSQLIRAGASYNVTVATHPSLPTQLCTIANGIGTMPEADVTNVAVTCVTAYLVTGTVTGLSGTGLTVQNNGADDLSIASGSTSYMFNTPVLDAATYNAAVLTQPTNPWQTCTYSSTPSGTIAAADVTLPSLDCVTNTYSVIVNISGLDYAGMELSLNGGAPVAVPAATTQVNLGSLASGGSYTIALTSPPAQTCSLFGGTGTVAGSNVTATVSCSPTPAVSIGGTVSGLTGSGLQFSLTGTATETKTVSAGATSYAFTSSLYYGDTYTVSLAAHPVNPWQTCTLPGAPVSGTISGGSVTLPAVTCTTNNYNIVANVSGHLFNGLSLKVNAGTPVSITAGTTPVTLATLPSGTGYTVSVQSHPTGQTCSITAGGLGTIGGGDAAVTVNCTSTTYTVSGNLSNLSGSGLALELSKNGSPVETINPSNGSYSFTTTFLNADTYSVAIATQPTSPSQTCSFASSASGTISAANVALPQLDCSTNNYNVSVDISGYTLLSGLQVRLNGGTTQSVTLGSTSFILGSLASGTGYTVEIMASGSGQSCSFPGPTGTATGTVTTGAVIAGTITCTLTPYTVGGSISGLSGAGLQLSMTGSVSQTLNPAAGTTSYTFGSSLVYNNTYTVTISGQPTTPWQTCTPLSVGSGTITNNVTLPAISCTTNTYSVIANVTGNAASGLQLKVNALTTVTFGASQTGLSLGSLASGTAYTVTKVADPAGYNCSITAGGTGTIAGASAAVTVSCVALPPPCTSFFVRDDSSWNSWYGTTAPISYANVAAAGGSFSGQAFDQSGHIYNFTGMCGGDYHVWVNAFDIGGSTEKSYGFWDCIGAGCSIAAYDWYAFDTFGWKRTALTKALSAGDHTWQIGSMVDGNYYTVGWDQIIVTQNPGYTPSGIISTPLLVDSLDAFSGWTNGGTLTGSVDMTAPASGEANLKTTGSTGHYLGFKKTFPASQPSYIGLWMRQDTAGTGPYLVLGGPSTSNANVVVFAYFTAGGITVSQAGSLNLGAIAIGQWYFLEIKNINWTTFTMDYYLDGVLKGNIGFRTNQPSVSELHFYSLGAAGSYDDVVIY